MKLDDYIDWYTNVLDKRFAEGKISNLVYAYCWSVANVYYDFRGMEEKKQIFLSDELNKTLLPDFIYKRIS